MWIKYFSLRNHWITECNPQSFHWPVFIQLITTVTFIRVVLCLSSTVNIYQPNICFVLSIFWFQWLRRFFPSFSVSSYLYVYKCGRIKIIACSVQASWKLFWRLILFFKKMTSTEFWKPAFDLKKKVSLWCFLCFSSINNPIHNDSIEYSCFLLGMLINSSWMNHAPFL